MAKKIKRFHVLEVGGEEYKLHIDARRIAELEKRLGFSPSMLIFNVGKAIKSKRPTQAEQIEAMAYMPTMEQYALVLHAALQSFEHGKTLDDAYDILTEYLQEKTTNELFVELQKILNVSGLMGETKEEVKEEE